MNEFDIPIRLSEQEFPDLRKVLQDALAVLNERRGMVLVLRSKLDQAEEAELLQEAHVKSLIRRLENGI